jgi:hypothetical protein
MIDHATRVASDVRGGTTSLRQITTEQLRNLRAHPVAYARFGVYDGQKGFLLFDADGTPLGIADTTDALFEAAAERGLAVVAIH